MGGDVQWGRHRVGTKGVGTGDFSLCQVLRLMDFFCQARASHWPQPTGGYDGLGPRILSPPRHMVDDDAEEAEGRESHEDVAPHSTVRRCTPQTLATHRLFLRLDELMRTPVDVPSAPIVVDPYAFVLPPPPVAEAVDPSPSSSSASDPPPSSSQRRATGPPSRRVPEPPRPSPGNPYRRPPAVPARPRRRPRRSTASRK